jgi:anti-anti-sigma factor
VDALVIDRDREGEVPVLRLKGDLDRLTADALDISVREAAAASSGPLVLDIALVEFIDSAGLRTLTRANALLQAAGRSLVIRNPSSGVLRLLELVGLREILTIITDAT